MHGNSNGFQENGLPAGVTFAAPALHEGRIASIAWKFHQQRNSTLGATAFPFLKTTEPFPSSNSSILPIAVFGLHLRDQPLNHQLLDCGATFAYKGKQHLVINVLLWIRGAPKARFGCYQNL